MEFATSFTNNPTFGHSSDSYLTDMFPGAMVGGFVDGIDLAAAPSLVLGSADASFGARTGAFNDVMAAPMFSSSNTNALAPSIHNTPLSTGIGAASAFAASSPPSMLASTSDQVEVSDSSAFPYLAAPMANVHSTTTTTTTTSAVPTSSAYAEAGLYYNSTASPMTYTSTVGSVDDSISSTGSTVDDMASTTFDDNANGTFQAQFSAVAKAGVAESLRALADAPAVDDKSAAGKAPQEKISKRKAGAAKKGGKKKKKTNTNTKKSKKNSAVSTSDADADANAAGNNNNGDDADDAAAKKKRKETAASLANMTEEERLERRRRKNRESAQQSRLRKRQRLATLEKEVADQQAINEAITAEKDAIEAENLALKKEMAYLKNVLRTSPNLSSLVSTFKDRVGLQQAAQASAQHGSAVCLMVGAGGHVDLEFCADCAARQQERLAARANNALGATSDASSPYYDSN